MDQIITLDDLQIYFKEKYEVMIDNHLTHYCTMYESLFNSLTYLFSYHNYIVPIKTEFNPALSSFSFMELDSNTEKIMRSINIYIDDYNKGLQFIKNKKIPFLKTKYHDPLSELVEFKNLFFYFDFTQDKVNNSLFFYILQFIEKLKIEQNSLTRDLSDIILKDIKNIQFHTKESLDTINKSYKAYYFFILEKIIKKPNISMKELEDLLKKSNIVPFYPFIIDEYFESKQNHKNDHLAYLEKTLISYINKEANTIVNLKVKPLNDILTGFIYEVFNKIADSKNIILSFEKKLLHNQKLTGQKSGFISIRLKSWIFGTDKTNINMINSRYEQTNISVATFLEDLRNSFIQLEKIEQEKAVYIQKIYKRDTQGLYRNISQIHLHLSKITLIAEEMNEYFQKNIYDEHLNKALKMKKDFFDMYAIIRALEDLTEKIKKCI